MIKEIRELQKIAKEYGSVILKNDDRMIAENLQMLSQAMSMTLPGIVAIYSDERMAEYREDQEYWLTQLKRIMDAIGRQDYFLAYDALVFELSANLEMLEKVLLQKGIE